MTAGGRELQVAGASQLKDKYWHDPKTCCFKSCYVYGQL